MDCDDDNAYSKGFYSTNLLAYKATLYIYTGVVSGPYFEYLVFKIIDDDDYDWEGMGHRLRG